MNGKDSKKKTKPGSRLALPLLVLVLAVLADTDFGGAVLGVGFLIFIGWLIARVTKQRTNEQGKRAYPRERPGQTERTAPIQPAERFDDCPRPFFCFHKDKGEHHVRRGKEIDPWDRPDIDIRKYQRQ